MIDSTSMYKMFPLTPLLIEHDIIQPAEHLATSLKVRILMPRFVLYNQETL
jgi:hypothetical protein